MHNYYAQPIQNTFVSKYCELLTDWSILLKEACPVFCIYLYSINYIYYKVPKTQTCFNEAEPTLEFNRSIIIIICTATQIAALSLKFPNNELG